MKDYQSKRNHRKRSPERMPQGFFEAFDRLYSSNDSLKPSERAGSPTRLRK